MTAQQSGRPKFGELAIRAGLMEEVHVKWALDVQAARRKAGVHLYIASILVQQQYISVEQAVEILAQQGVRILVDPTSNFRYNVHNFNPQVQYKSPESPATLKPLDRVDSLLVRGDIGLRQLAGKTQAQAGAQVQARQAQRPAGAAGQQPRARQAQPGQQRPAANRPQQQARPGQQAARGGPAGQWGQAASQDGWDEEEWGKDDDAPGSRKQGAAGPVFAELTAEERESGEDFDEWFGKTILDDGSLAQQLRKAALALDSESAPSRPGNAQPTGKTGVVDHRTFKARPGTIALIALPHPGYDNVYRSLTDACIALGIATVRMDDVKDATSIWKCIEKGLAISDLVIADFSEHGKPTSRVAHQAKAARDTGKSVLAISTNSGASDVVKSLGIQGMHTYSTVDASQLHRIVQEMVPAMLRRAGRA